MLVGLTFLTKIGFNITVIPLNGSNLSKSWNSV